MLQSKWFGLPPFDFGILITRILWMELIFFSSFSFLVGDVFVNWSLIYCIFCTVNLQHCIIVVAARICVLMTAFKIQIKWCYLCWYFGCVWLTTWAVQHVAIGGPVGAWRQQAQACLFVFFSFPVSFYFFYFNFF